MRMKKRTNERTVAFALVLGFTTKYNEINDVMKSYENMHKL